VPSRQIRLAGVDALRLATWTSGWKERHDLGGIGELSSVPACASFFDVIT
jgi:aryl carrier-like protein